MELVGKRQQAALLYASGGADYAAAARAAAQATRATLNAARS